MDKLRDAGLYNNETREIKDHMINEVEKIFIIQEKEVISYNWIVMGAKTKQEALELYNEEGESYDEIKEDGEIYNIFKVNDSWEYHRTMKPTVLQSLKVRKCALRLDYDCNEIIDHDQNVCESCLRTARLKSGVPCDAYGEPLESEGEE